MPKVAEWTCLMALYQNHKNTTDLLFSCRFRNKYHPVCKSQLKAKSLEGYKSRSAAFSILQDHGLVKDVPLCNTVSKQITKLMDSGEP